jgi:hypothetical protein
MKDTQVAVTLGATVRDRLTGFEGIVTGQAQYLTGCEMALVQPKVKGEDKEWVESRWFDEPRLEVLEGKPAFVAVPPGMEGPDKPAPRR